MQIKIDEINNKWKRMEEKLEVDIWLSFTLRVSLEKDRLLIFMIIFMIASVNLIIYDIKLIISKI